MKKRFYAVKVGRQCNMIVETWAECEELVKGVSGAKFKGFAWEHEAEAYLTSTKPPEVCESRIVADWPGKQIGKKAKAQPTAPGFMPATDKIDKYGFFKPRYYRKHGVQFADYGKTFGNYEGELYTGVNPPW